MRSRNMCEHVAGNSTNVIISETTESTHFTMSDTNSDKPTIVPTEPTEAPLGSPENKVNIPPPPKGEVKPSEESGPSEPPAPPRTSSPSRPKTPKPKQGSQMAEPPKAGDVPEGFKDLKSYLSEVNTEMVFNSLVNDSSTSLAIEVSPTHKIVKQVDLKQIGISGVQSLSDFKVRLFATRRTYELQRAFKQDKNIKVTPVSAGPYLPSRIHWVPLPTSTSPQTYMDSVKDLCTLINKARYCFKDNILILIQGMSTCYPTATEKGKLQINKILNTIVEQLNKGFDWNIVNSIRNYFSQEALSKPANELAEWLKQSKQWTDCFTDGIRSRKQARDDEVLEQDQQINILRNTIEARAAGSMSSYDIIALAANLYEKVKKGAIFEKVVDSVGVEVDDAINRRRSRIDGAVEEILESTDFGVDPNEMDIVKAARLKSYIAQLRSELKGKGREQDTTPHPSPSTTAKPLFPHGQEGIMPPPETRATLPGMEPRPEVQPLSRAVSPISDSVAPEHVPEPEETVWEFIVDSVWDDETSWWVNILAMPITVPITIVLGVYKTIKYAGSKIWKGIKYLFHLVRGREEAA
ncbi:hypothetical protein [Rhizoctonia solani fusarivirus 1]|uniref:Uncharacterized protein n=1 Tax=Rhizoctonia solani fusarivirus 1 TaxID=2599953 RepID=A0AAE6HYR9_9VIRU|nr:hypothetical protein QKQ63_gp4 [Rhizoctonia solani fusarivirus 1]QDW92696.1 hypothetical protein [Rhizoctonia solani fusarivirus 1]